MRDRAEEDLLCFQSNALSVSLDVLEERHPSADVGEALQSISFRLKFWSLAESLQHLNVFPRSAVDQ